MNLKNKKTDASIVKLSDWLLQKVLRGHWSRKSNQRMRTWYHYRHYGYLIDEWSNNDVPSAPNNGPTWMFWWQGETSMPPMVKKCYELAKVHAPQNHPVVLLTEDNYKQFITIPGHIINKVKAKTISLTHFSDILRVSLLYEYGGLWMDATLYTAASIPERLFDQLFFSIRTPDDGQWVSRCLWTGFFMGGIKGHPLFGFMRQLFFDYWKEHDELLDYFLIDLGIAMAYDNIPQIKLSIDDGVWNTDKLFVPEKNIAQPIDIKKYQNIVAEWPFFKMTYRDFFGKLMIKNPEGQYTWYGYMLTH